MKTTLALDPDVAARLKRLRAVEEKAKLKRKIWTKPLALDGSPIGPLDNVADVLAIAEGDAFK